jgi:hypothetical protein
MRQTLRNWALITGYHAGVSTERLARIYYPAAPCASVSGERDR